MSEKKPPSKNVWVELKGKSHGESLTINPAAISAIEEVRGGYKVYCGGFTFTVTREQELHLWDVVCRMTGIDRIVHLEELPDEAQE